MLILTFVTARFHKLMTAVLLTAAALLTAANEYTLDKEQRSFDDILLMVLD